MSLFENLRNFLINFNSDIIYLIRFSLSILNATSTIKLK